MARIGGPKHRIGEDQPTSLKQEEERRVEPRTGGKIRLKYGRGAKDKRVETS